MAGALPGSIGCLDSVGSSLHFHPGRAGTDVEVEDAARRVADLGLWRCIDPGVGEIRAAAVDPHLAGFVLDVLAMGGDGTPSESTQADEDLDRPIPREREVLRHPARGYTYKEIALLLSISVKPMETRASAALRKLQLSNRHEPSRWAAARRIW